MTAAPELPQILAILRTDLHLDVAGADVDLFQDGLLDSLAFVDLLLRLEQAFGIRVDPEQLDPAQFRTPAEIARYVQARRG